MIFAEMHENLASAEPSVTEFDAIVEAIDGREVRLDRTSFYAEGGGQPADRGTLAGVDGVDANAVSERIDELVGDSAEVVVLVGSAGSTFVVAGTTGDENANESVQDVTDRFGGGGGGGGGRPSLAQGGGLSADPEDDVASLSDAA